MSRLVESIRSEDGKLLNIDLHNERMIRSLREVFGLKTNISLEKFIKIPETANVGVFKCRVEYDREIHKIEFIPYTVKSTMSLKIIEDNNIEYYHKFADRNQIEKLFSKRETAADILIIKNGMVTDTSYSNVVFRDHDGNWITPATCLLPGTRRTQLLNCGIIKEAIIAYSDIKKYSELKLINAMMGLEDTEGLPIRNIY
jgi:4-amino-4-deoxychorismate lyase